LRERFSPNGEGSASRGQHADPIGLPGLLRLQDDRGSEDGEHEDDKQ
jgi:hypothetical protein